MREDYDESHGAWDDLRLRAGGRELAPRLAWLRRGAVLLLLLLGACGGARGPERSGAPDAAAALANGADGYREPSAAVTRLLTAPPPPEPLLHARSRRVALLFREPVIPLERLARPRLGLAGFRLDPESGVSGIAPLVTRVEVVATDAPAESAPVAWQPTGGMRLDHVRFSPDGRTLSALAVPARGPARLALFDVERGRERVLEIPINPAWGEPCRWVGADALLCRVEPAGRGAPPAPRPAPTIVEHDGGPVPVRTYPDLLENAFEDRLFAYYFATELARVDLAGHMERVPHLAGLLASVDASPNGDYAVVTRLEPPFPRLVPARRFPSVVELWDVTRGTRLYASRPSGFGLPQQDLEREDPRRAEWKPGATPTLGYIEVLRDAAGGRWERWLALGASSGGVPREIARSAAPILRFGWTTAGTPWFATAGDSASEVRVHAVFEDGPRLIWSRSTTDRYGDPGRALRLDGADGPVLEVDGGIYLAGDGLGPGGPEPFLERFDLRSGRTERLFTAEPGVFESVLGVLDVDGPVFVTSRETETEPPNLFLRRGEERTPLRSLPTPYPDLANASRRVVSYTRKDGVALSGTLYLRAGHRDGQRLPTLVWIYPYEFSDREQAEQLDVRAFRFHRVKGPSPLAAVVEGYAVLVNPSVPILYEEGAVNDDYLPQLVASLDAAVDHLTAIGVTDPARVAVGGRSYGAFSTANLLIHSDRFATGVAMSGAYNRTLTPFGFQHEKRSFWEATDLYTRISPFFSADAMRVPILLVHGGADENAGTPPIQARRFFHALAGKGKPARYVELPYEGHHYWARENVLLAAAEMLDWLDRRIGAQAPSAGGSSPTAR